MRLVRTLETPQYSKSTNRTLIEGSESYLILHKYITPDRTQSRRPIGLEAEIEEREKVAIASLHHRSQRKRKRVARCFDGSCRNFLFCQVLGNYNH